MAGGCSKKQLAVYQRDVFDRLTPFTADGRQQPSYGQYVNLDMLYRYDPLLGKMVEAVFHPDHVQPNGFKDYGQGRLVLYDFTDPDALAEFYDKPSEKIHEPPYLDSNAETTLYKQMKKYMP